MDIKALIAEVEKRVYGENEAAAKDGKINAGTKEVSVFNKLLNEQVRNGEITEDNAKTFFNEQLSLGNTQAPTSANTRRRAGSDADATFVFNNNITINMYVSVNVESIIDDLIKGLDLNKIVDRLIDAMGKNESALEEFVVGIVNTYADNMNLKLGDLQDLLKQILEKLGKIEGHTEALHNLLLQQFEVLKVMGINVDALMQNFNKYAEQDKLSQEQQNTILGKIYDAITKFSDQFGEFKAEFNTFIQNHGTDMAAVLAFLELIEADTSEGNKIGLEALGYLKENNETNKEILEYNKLIYEELKGLRGDVKAGFEQLALDIYAAVAPLDEKLGNIEQLLKDIKAALNVLPQILEKLGDIEELNGKNFAAILVAIGKIQPGPGPSPVDLTELMEFIGERADDIIAAINDHDVHVTVDVTGQVECHCDHGGGNPHEGVIGELNNIIMAASRRSNNGSDGDGSTRISSVEEHSSLPDGKYNIGGQIVIVKDGEKYDLQGRKID